MYVQLRVPQTIDRLGLHKRFQPGDWVEVGEQLAKQWLASGIAWIPPQRINELLTKDCGIASLGPCSDHLRSWLDDNDRLGFEQVEEPSLPFPHTLIWDPNVHLRKELVPVGFAQLDIWQVACPLWDYNELATHEGDEAEKERTKAVIHDLRVPMYDTRLMFVKRCGDTRELIDMWQAEGRGRLAFLRALYQVKPMMLALPVTWSGKQGPQEN